MRWKWVHVLEVECALVVESIIVKGPFTEVDPPIEKEEG